MCIIIKGARLCLVANLIGAIPPFEIAQAHGTEPKHEQLMQRARPRPPKNVRQARVRDSQALYREPALLPLDAAAPLPPSKPSFWGPWFVTVNGKAFVSPTYVGAAQYSFVGFPTLSLRRPGEAPTWSAADEHLGFRVWQTPLFALGPVLAYRGGRYDMTNALGPLKGVHDIRWTLEAGLFGEIWLLPETLRARAEIRHGFRPEDGFVGTLSSDYIYRWDRYTFAIGPRLELADGKFMNDAFGVTYTDALVMPQLSPYRPNGGLYAAGAYGSVSYQQSESWGYTLHGGYDLLTGPASASPIVSASGSRNQWILGAIISYTFGVGQ
jgi:outer membrane scaffolding protein for murein synthesis (MipA/OmpV family)